LKTFRLSRISVGGERRPRNAHARNTVFQFIQNCADGAVQNSGLNGKKQGAQRRSGGAALGCNAPARQGAGVRLKVTLEVRPVQRA
jgi:hypothetical protein